MKYLITGHKGFIGTNLCNYLKLHGDKFVGIDYPDDILKNGSLDEFKIFSDIVIHLAAETNVRKSINNPVTTFNDNCRSTVNILDFARKYKKKVIFISSCGASSVTNPYSASKLAGEAICKAFRKSYGLNVNILRFSNVYGPHSIHKNSVTSNFIKSKLNGEKAKIFGTGNQVRDFIYVKDVCRAICNCQIDAYNDDYEVCTGRLTTINTLAKLIGCEVEYLDPIKGEIPSLDMTNTVTTTIPLEQGLESTIEWFIKNYKVN